MPETKTATFTRSRVISQDGTTIGYQTIGRGPGLVVVHGGFRAAQHYHRLAQALADSFTVHIVDRRGRGDSGPQGDAYSIAKECEDVAAVLRETGSAYLFGHSYGAFVALESALVNPQVTKMALYEPPVGGFPSDWIPAFEAALANGDSLEALVVFIKGMGLSADVDKMPKWLLKVLFRLMLSGPKGKLTKALLPTLVLEFREGRKLDSRIEKYGAIAIGTLIIAGDKSPAWLLEPAGLLKETIPGAQLLVLPGLDHNAPDENAPTQVAQHLRAAFA
ncbi:MAG TPA: alpha/beta hydrolase [Symbiobacteriaceae bacterium]|jgi:pimeloyl-ACP methyl ester carboxylesterase